MPKLNPNAKEQPATPEPPKPPKAKAAAPAKGKARTVPAGLKVSQETPLVTAKAGRETKPPKLGASPPFYFRFHPDRWCVLGDHVVPLLGKLKLQGGLNRVEKRNETLHIRVAVSHSEDEGWITIPWDVEGPGTSYIRKIDGTELWISRFERVFPDSEHIATDEAGYIAFLHKLVEDGVVPAPELHVLEALEGKTRQSWGEVADRARHVPSYAALAERLARDLEVVRAEIDKRRGETAPAATAPELPPIADAAGGAS